MKCWAKRGRRQLTLAVSAALLAGAFSIMPSAQAMPAGGISATAAISQSGNTLNINGQAANNIIAWDSFSIASGETVAFGGTHNYLNYVTGGARSEIYGAMTGGGNVFLINPNGILFGPGAQISVGSLYASTRTLTEADFKQFDSSGMLSAAVPDTGDIVNRMESSLSNMKITLEGDCVTFTHYAGGKVGGDANYTAAANEVDVGYAGTTAPTAKPSNLSCTPDLTWMKLVNNASELNGINEDPPGNLAGNYMLSNTWNDETTVSPQDGKASIIYQYKKNIVGTSNYLIYYFSGKFNGAGHSIKLDIDKSTETDVGLFDQLSGAVVRNLTLTGTVTGKNNVGALAGTVSGATISSVYNQANVTGSGNGESDPSLMTGGLVGVADENNSSSFKNVGNSGTITGMRGVGGIVGYMPKGSITNAYNTGDVSGTRMVGGIAAFNLTDLTITHAYNAGNISGNYEVGGIVGHLEAGTIESSYNTGTVQSSGTVTGGLVGRMQAGQIKNSFNTGEVTTVEHAGGIIGGAVISGQLDVQNVYNTGAVKATNSVVDTNVGGVIGYVSSNGGTLTLERVYQTGAVTQGTGQGGAIIGTVNNANPAHVTVSNVFFQQGTGNANYGTAKTADELKQASTFAGWGSNLDTTGQSTSAAWRIYDGKTTPLLTNFLSRLDFSQANKTVDYDGNVHYTFYVYGTPAALKGSIVNFGTEAGTYKSDLYSEQLWGYNINNSTPTLTIKASTPEPTPEPTPTPTPTPEPTPEPTPTPTPEQQIDMSVITAAYHIEGSGEDDIKSDSILQDSGSSASLDATNAVHEVSLGDRASMDGAELVISSADSGKRETEHHEIADFSDGDEAGKAAK